MTTADRIAALLVIVALVILAAVAIGGGANGSDAQSSDRQPTTDSGSGDGAVPPATRNRIAASKDCEELQVIFDASVEAHGRFRDAEARDLTMMQVQIGIMDAAHDRMHEVGC